MKRKIRVYRVRKEVDKMVQSLNTRVDLVIDATSFTGVSDYGKIRLEIRGLNFIIQRSS